MATKRTAAEKVEAIEQVIVNTDDHRNRAKREAWEAIKRIIRDEDEPAVEVAPVAEPGDDDELVIPPKVGPGSNAAAWRSYAIASGVEVPEDAKRDAVIEALEAAGVPTEPVEEPEAEGDDEVEDEELED